jgi:hypothetical protein
MPTRVENQRPWKRQARTLLAGLFDVWVIDYKFGNDQCARRLREAPNYTAVVRRKSRLGPRERGTRRAPSGHAWTCGLLLATGCHVAGRTNARRESESANRILAWLEVASTLGTTEYGCPTLMPPSRFDHARSLGIKLVD